MCLIFKTSSVTPDFFYIFNLTLSFSTCSESFEKIVRGNFWARTSLIWWFNWKIQQGMLSGRGTKRLGTRRLLNFLSRFYSSLTVTTFKATRQNSWLSRILGHKYAFVIEQLSQPQHWQFCVHELQSPRLCRRTLFLLMHPSWKWISNPTRQRFMVVSFLIWISSLNLAFKPRWKVPKTCSKTPFTSKSSKQITPTVVLKI